MISLGLYVGSVMHRRIVSPPHRFVYNHFWFALDLDRLEATASRLRLFSVERANLFSFRSRDYADGKRGPLRDKIERLCSGFDVSGPMILLATPRLLGFAFNPLSVYFCHDSDNAPSAIAWEVTNTFGSRHTYVIAVEQIVDGVVRQQCTKRLHVSPFLGMDLIYRFRVEILHEKLSIGIIDQAADGAAMAAAWRATRRDLTDQALATLLLKFPVANFKVLLAIYWEAFRLWAKGARFHKAPPDTEFPIASRATSRGHLSK